MTVALQLFSLFLVLGVGPIVVLGISLKQGNL
jgi:hypothetical protein